MPFFFLYLLKFSISLALMYTFYQLLLRPLTFYQWNRFYLLGYTVLSLFIPFIDITGWVNGKVADDHGLLQTIPAIGGIAAATPVEAGSFFQANGWLAAGIILVAGSLVLAMRLGLQYLSLRKVTRAAKLIAREEISIYHVDKPVGPFSFGKKVFVNTQLHGDDDLRKIIAHEMVHVKQKHTVDILLVELLCVLNWFNPVAWLVRQAVRQNLEFIADDKVLQHGLDARQYQYLLLKVVGIPQYSIAPNFNLSSLKKRITMINKMKTGRVHLVKFLFIVPMLAFLLLAFRSRVQPVGAGAETLQTEKIFSFSAANADSTPATRAVPPVPPRPAKTGVTPTAPVAPLPPNALPAVPVKAPVPPVAPQDTVPSISVRKQPVAKTSTLIVATKDGKTKKYDLSKPVDQVAFERDFGYAPTTQAIIVKPFSQVESVLQTIRAKTVSPNEPIYIVDGKTVTGAEVHGLDPSVIGKVNVIKGEKATDLFGQAGAAGAVIMTTRDTEGKAVSVQAQTVIVNGFADFDGVFYLNGAEKTAAEIKAVTPDSIKSVTVMTGADAEKIYKDKGKNGVILITTK